MIKVYFVSEDQFKLYDQKLPPQDRWTNNPLADLGVKNFLCGDGALVVSPEMNQLDKELPAKFYLVTEKKEVL